MILLKKVTDLCNYLELQHKQGKKYGFIPTMGALHEGHISLMNNSKQADDLSISSIFVNPVQFNDPADFEKYPVTLEKDIALLEAAGCDIAFIPSVEEIYPYGTNLKFHYDLGFLETILEGQYRPGHFQGVCKVVHRLLEIVKPDNLYLGQKDYQQCLVIKKLIELVGMKDLIKLNISPTVRDAGGLAMSSRNMRLTKDEKIKATAIYQSLQFIKDEIKKGELATIKNLAVNSLVSKGLRVDYIAIADADNLQIPEQWDGNQKLVALAAVYLNKVRLIDNLFLT